MMSGLVVRDYEERLRELGHTTLEAVFLGLLDPDPLVKRYGSGSFYHKAKMVRKTLISTVL